MTSQAVYCLSLQIRPPSDENVDGISSDVDRNVVTTLQEKQSHNTPSIVSIRDGKGHERMVPIQQQQQQKQPQHQLQQQHSSSATTTTTITTQAHHSQPHQHQQQQQHHHQQPQQHSNIILVRGSRNENGQIILQNSHELLNLLNDEDKPILLQHPRFKTKQQSEGAILLQPAGLKGTHQIDGHHGTVLLQSATVKKSTTLPEGSIIVQQRLNKNGTADGPILLQTLKRLDKSQSILVFRNPNNTSTSTTITTTNTTTSNRIKNLITTVEDIDDKTDHHRQPHQHQHQQLQLQQQQQTVITPPAPPATQPKSINTPLGSDGEPIKLPDNLESLPRADHFPTQRHRWNTNEEIAAILISFDKHSEWQSKEVRTRPKSGSMLLYSRKKVRYRRDGYCWKKRKDGKTTREDHMKLKVQGTECIYGCYVHSAILPTFHRRCYWLLQNPDIVLVHYLNVPYPDDNKMAVITPSLALWGDKKEWTKEELISQLKPMFFSEDEPDATNEIELSKFQTAETVEAIVGQLMEKQRLARQAALVKQLECGCPDSTCADGKSCSHPMRRITAAKSANEKRQENNNQVSSTTPNVLIGSRLYSRWVDRRGRDQLTEITNPSTTNGPIHFQVIPTSSQTHTISNQLITRTNSNINNSSINNPTNQQQQQQQLSNITNSANHHHLSNGNANSNNNATNNNNSNSNNNNNNNQMTINTNNHNNGTGGGAGCGGSGTSGVVIGNHNQLTATVVAAHSNQISLTATSSNQQHQSPQQQQQQQQQHHQTIIDRNNHRTNIITSNNNRMGVSAPIATSAPPLVLNLSQIQSSSGGSLLILNGQQQSFVCQTQQQQHHSQQQQRKLIKDENNKSLNQSAHQSITPNLVPKLEAMDSTPSPTEKLHPQQQQQQQQSQQQQHIDHIFDSNMSYSSTQQNTPIASPAKTNNNLAKELHDTFFNETLELSQEDIQKTLSANMPLGGHNVEPIGGEINPMDFINNCCDDVVGPSVHDDDVFVNLDAFDMFVEFPDLELDTKNSFMHGNETMTQSIIKSSMNNAGGAGSVHASNASNDDAATNTSTDDDTFHINESSHQDVYNISDYSPEWAYTEGGIKVLVTGPWDSNSNYTVLFDAFPVPTTIVQSGVLRCYCPAHEVGLATLQVACDGYVISNSVIFEYKSPPNIETACEGTANDSLYKLSLYNRLESIDERMQIKTEPKDSPEDTVLLNTSNFEERLVNYCQLLTSKQWRSMTPGSWVGGYKGMTLLHLASALGYSKLVCAMLTWRTENPNAILETEIDALSQDTQGYTPLMWSCARGHVEVATILYKWNYNAINVKNRLQQTPLDVAKCNGFNNVISEFQRLESLRKQQQNTLQNSNQTSSHNLSNFSILNSTNKNSSTSISSIIINHHNYAFTTIASSASAAGTSSNTTTAITKTRTSPSSPSSSTNNPHLTNNPMFNSNPYLSASTLSPTSNNHHNELLANGGLDADCSSPLSMGSVTSLNSNRSHDGVFLRPGAVSSLYFSSQSPPAVRLSKRPSVDSGINMDVRTISRAGKIIREQQLKLSRFDRSMSLPVSNSPQNYTNTDAVDCFSISIDSAMEGGSTTYSSSSSSSGNSNATNLSNMSLLSPLRKMDFALWESDAKVLTLAEQIIAAMPERIKNESEDMMTLGSPISDSLNAESGISVLNDTFMEPLLDSLPSSNIDQEFSFEFNDQNYRYHDVGTPCSSLSPASSGPLQSPASYSIAPDPPMGSPSPPPTTEDFTEFLQASSTIVNPFESAFSNLTLTDSEQRELYEAAKCIQKAYRSYKGRKKLEEDKERSAAIVIQNYYRRYKQYAYYRQMTHAALIIQNGYRSYCENKRFKKSQNQSSSNNVITIQDSQCLQSYYNNYQNEHHHQSNNGGTSNISSSGASPSASSSGTMSKEPSPSGPLKRTYSQRTQNQAARKIQQFMRQSKMNIWDDHMGTLTTERTSRKREAGPPTPGGIPTKLAVSRSNRNPIQRSK